MKNWIAAILLVLAIGCASGHRQQGLAWSNIDTAAGVPAIENGTLTLRGQRIRTQPAYSAPVTVQIELQLEKHEAENGIFMCAFVPANQPANSSSNEFVAVMVQYIAADDVVVVTVQSTRLERNNWSYGAPLGNLAGLDYRLKVAVTKDGTHVTFNGKESKVPAMTVPYDRFQIELSAVPGNDRWRVRNFVVQ